MKSNEYQCAYCKGIFEKGWSDEDAKKESEEIFGKHPDEWNGGQDIICDDCFNGKLNPKSPKNAEFVHKAKLMI